MPWAQYNYRGGPAPAGPLRTEQVVVEYVCESQQWQTTDDEIRRVE